jgi:hypothetical protein
LKLRRDDVDDDGDGGDDDDAHSPDSDRKDIRVSPGR